MGRISEILSVQDQKIELNSKKPLGEQAMPMGLTIPYATMPLMPQKTLTYASVFWIQTLTCQKGKRKEKKKKK